MKVNAVIFAAALAFAETIANAQTMKEQPNSNVTTAGSQPSSSGSQESDPGRILQKLHAGNEGEIKVGKMAQSNGASAAVKEYGKMLVDDHSKADRQVKDVAKTMHVKADADSKLTKEDKEEEKQNDKTMDELKRMKGQPFDDAFATAMVKDHEKDIAFVKQCQASAPGELKALLDKILPDLQKHLDKAKEIQGQRNTASSR